MSIEPKYSLNQVVYTISFSQQSINKPCTFCEGTGQIIGKDNRLCNCPMCGGKKEVYSYAKQHYYVSTPVTIGYIRVTVFHKKQKTRAISQEEDYMCYETGIGGGRLYHKDDLYDSYDDALIHCALLNKKLEDEVREKFSNGSV